MKYPNKLKERFDIRKGIQHIMVRSAVLREEISETPTEPETTPPPPPPILDERPLVFRVPDDWYPDYDIGVTFDLGTGSALIDFDDGNGPNLYEQIASITYPSLAQGYTIILTPVSLIQSLKTDVPELQDWGSTNLIKNIQMTCMSPTVPTVFCDWLYDTSSMFKGCRGFNQDLSGWDTGHVLDMSYMFYECSSLNTDLGGWDVSNVRSMRAMFVECYSRVGTLSMWDVSSVEDMSYMFSSCRISEDVDIRNWDVSRVTNMSHMFDVTTSSSNFNCDLSKWNMSQVLDMSFMFAGVHSLFDEDYGHGMWSVERWDTSKVTDMESMFDGCHRGVASYLNNWKVHNVKNMRRLFAGCQRLNHIGDWDVSSVTNMEEMFQGAYQFNSDLSKWDMRKVEKIDRMFDGVNMLTTSLENWQLDSITNQPVGVFDNTLLGYMPDMNKPRWNGDIIT